MSRKTQQPRPGDPRVLLDEVGIASVVWNRFRLKTAFQLAYRHETGRLRPFAVEGRALPCLDGVAIAPALFGPAVPPEDKPLLARLERAMHVENLGSAAATDLVLFLDYPADMGERIDIAAEARDLVDRIDAAGLDAGQVVWMIAAEAGTDAAEMRFLADAIRNEGMSVGLDENGPLFSAPEVYAALSPSFVRVGSARLANGGPPEMTGLMRALFGVLRSRGALVIVSGIADPGTLDLALSIGADAVQGNFVSRPALAGAQVELLPLDAKRMVAQTGTVVPLFA